MKESLMAHLTSEGEEGLLDPWERKDGSTKGRGRSVKNEIYNLMTNGQSKEFLARLLRRGERSSVCFC